jgi:uncharacterized protein YegJ (DUF2314 family)
MIQTAMHRLHLALLIAAFTLAAQPALAEKAIEPAKAEQVMDIQLDDPATQDAIKTAQTTLNDFLRVAASGDPKFDNISVRIVVRQGKKAESFWITPFTVKGNNFRGTINNTPEIVTKVKAGQRLRFKRADIVDWMYVDLETKAMHGNFTTCVLLAKAPPEEIAQMKRAYGLDCSR